MYINNILNKIASNASENDSYLSLLPSELHAIIEYYIFRRISVYKSKKSECYVINNWLQIISHNADDIYKKSSLLPLDKYPKCTVYGRECIMRRSIGFFSDKSDGYSYSGQISKSKPLTDWMKDLMNCVNSFLNTKFNGILVNQYETGEEVIGAHSDDERELFDGKVACISLGSDRTFRIKNKTTLQRVDTTTKHGQLLVMQGDFQKECTHVES